jgi:hypothetical protein
MALGTEGATAGANLLLLAAEIVLQDHQLTRAG